MTDSIAGNHAAVSGRLAGIERVLTELAALKEKIQSHDRELVRHGRLLDNHNDRLHEGELWRERHGDTDKTDKIITSIRQDIVEVHNKIDDAVVVDSRTEGQKDVVKEILKWVSMISIGVILFLIKGK